VLVASGYSGSLEDVMKKGGSSREGYTLVEVIVAATIFGMVIAGGIAGVRMGFTIVENSRHHTRVSQILQSEVESLRSLSWKELKKLPAKEEVDINPEFDTSVYDAYTLTRVIREESSSLRKIEITVNYLKGNGKPVELKYLTFFAEGGVNDYYYRTI
jgi:prepilin-type N-terminal cleavage/methylation domain-containing protein